MSIQFEVDIQMDQSTVDTLVQHGYALDGFMAVELVQGQGVPLLWFRIDQYYTYTPVKWSLDYQAFTSSSPIATGARIAETASYPVSFGQVLHVNSSAGTGQVTDGSGTNTITISNDTNTAFTCGVAQAGPQGFAPICALPLDSDTQNVVAPLGTVLLIFSAAAVEPGTVVEQAFDAGLLVELWLAPTQAVSFDFESGWSCPPGGTCTAVQKGEALAPLLVDNPFAPSRQQQPPE